MAKKKEPLTVDGVLREFVADCEALVGTLQHDKNYTVFVANAVREQWYDLGDTYERARQVLDKLNKQKGETK